jgi:hypothetical protein
MKSVSYKISSSLFLSGYRQPKLATSEVRDYLPRPLDWQLLLFTWPSHRFMKCESLFTIIRWWSISTAVRTDDKCSQFIVYYQYFISDILSKKSQVFLFVSSFPIKICADIYQYLELQPTQTWRTILLHGKNFPNWTLAIIRPWRNNMNVYRKRIP